MLGMDKRPVIEQVKSGFKIAGAILISSAAALSFISGYIDVVTPEKGHVALGWAILVVVTATLLFTVRFWANWFCGVASYLAVRSTFLIFFVHKGTLSFPVAIGLTVSLWLIAIFSIRSYKKRTFSKFDQLSITAAAICVFWGFARLGTMGDNAMLLPLLIGIPLLLISASEKPLKHVFRNFSTKAVTPSN
jgi:hypothetical protein